MDRRFKMAKFNAQERYNRRLWVMDMIAVWDYQHPATDNTDSLLSTSSDDMKQQDLDYYSYLDYMTAKMTLYDEDYRTRAIAFKNALTDYDSDVKLTAQDRSRIDAESRLRQSRTQELWKGLARVRDLHAQTISRDPPLTTARQSSPSPYCRSHSFNAHEITPVLIVDSPSADLFIIGEGLNLPLSRHGKSY